MTTLAPGAPAGAGHGLRVQLDAIAPGAVTLALAEEHRIKVHTGAPSRGQCSAHRFVYTRGDIDILPVGWTDSWRQEDAATSVVVSLAPSLLERVAAETGVPADRAGLESRHLFRDPQIEHLAWALDAEHRAGYPSGRLYVDSLGLALAAHLVGSYGAATVTRRGLSALQRARLTDYIEQHLDSDLSLDELAAVAALSASHLKTLFKRSMGMPVHAYVVLRRVHRARDLLLHTELPASRIALDAGFANQSHMARCMRRVLGVTPKALARGRDAEMPGRRSAMRRGAGQSAAVALGK